MNIRKIYLAVILVLSGSLFYQWNAENKVVSQAEHMSLAKTEGLIGAVTYLGLLELGFLVLMNRVFLSITLNQVLRVKKQTMSCLIMARVL